MKRLILFLFLILSTNLSAEEKKITADELKDTIANMPKKSQILEKMNGKKQKNFS